MPVYYASQQNNPPPPGYDNMATDHKDKV